MPERAERAGPRPEERIAAAAAGVGRALRRWALFILIPAATLVAYVSAGNAYLLSTTSERIVPAVEAAPARPWVIVLGNRVFPGNIPSRELGRRLDTALALYRAGRAQKIIVSGRTRSGYDEPRTMAAWLVERGVPATDVVLDGGGHRTAATMANAAALGVRSALIATQGYHLPRSLYLARHAGIDAIGVPSRPSGDSLYRRVWTFFRETTARAEIILEVALRGVRG